MMDRYSDPTSMPCPKLTSPSPPQQKQHQQSHLKRMSPGQNHKRKKRVAFAPWFIFAVVISSFSSWISPTTARNIIFCSHLNTGAGYNFVLSIYQSNGFCYDKCMEGQFAFAIVQGNACWCSNYVPGTEDTGCDESCPGYPMEQCGNTKMNLYGYMALPNKPSGTMSAATPVSTTSSEPAILTVTAKVPPTTVIITQTPSPKPTSTSEEEKTSITLPETPETTPAPSASSTTTPTALPGVTVYSTIGGFQTVIISQPTQAPSSPSPSNDVKQDSNFASNAGRVAGLVIGLILLLVLIIAIILLLRRRRYQQQELAALSGSSSPTSENIPAGGAGLFGRQRSRSLSTLGLIGEKGRISRETSPPVAQNFTGSTIAVPPQAAGGSPPCEEIYDQRLDPGRVYLRFDPLTGSSRMSVRSLRDDQDYSRRVLRLANPDD